MDCSPELLDAYVDGGLGDDAYRRVQRHVLRCRQCQNEVAELRALKAALRAAADLDGADLGSASATGPRVVPAGFQRNIADIVGRVRFQEARRQRERPRKRFWQGAVIGGTAAAVAVGAVIVAVMAPGGGWPGDEGQAYASTVEAVVSEHTRRALLMDVGVDDWHTVWEWEP